MPLERFTLFADGLTEPTNPNGYGCCAYVVYLGDVDGAKCMADLPPVVAYGHACIARPGEGVTNNICEYRAVRAALKWAVRHAAEAEVELRTDSQLVVRQVFGDWACNADHLRPLRDQCRALLAQLPHCRLVWVSRTKNIPADELTRLAYAEARGQK